MNCPGKRKQCLFTVTIGVALAGCCVNASASIDADVESLTNGTIDNLHESVVPLTGPSEVIACSGTLVAPKLVLTAAHCLTSFGRIDRILVDDSSAESRRTVAVAATHPHPDFDLESLRNDIAVLELASAVEELAPSPVELSLEPSVGNSVSVVGFGITEAPTENADGGLIEGLRRSGEARISTVEETSLRLTGTPSQPCEGDSGGPIFGDLDGNPIVIGVTSYGDSQCSSFAVATRTDAFSSFLNPWLHHESSPTCSASLGTARGHTATWFSALFCAAVLRFQRRLARARNRARDCEAGSDPLRIR